MVDGLGDFFTADDEADAARNRKAFVGAVDGVRTAAAMADDTDRERRRSRARWLGRIFWILVVSVLVGWLAFALFAA